MKKMITLKNSFLLIGILLYYHVHSQGTESVTIKVASKIPDSITERAVKTIILDVQNISNDYIEIKNAPIIHVDYKVLKKISNNYINMDSNCIFMPQPMYPGDNYEGIKLKKGKHLNIPTSFPPLCNLLEKNGAYKIKYFFTYTFHKKSYTIETGWYDYTCVFR